ncbi:hypothetical protein [Amphritea japonica]|uniref:Porin domain-containing protein n=1 Tax=Amphritea japonica ATCC BAA-1530 TaxID=1278309 RepID=A0A7R6SS34_9GAMM|nr:hypothetical protein [Amphritea japonica]BBB25831.1 conserved hypothetical protein [Amphritea japonica ATCC BAA-1530]
MNKQLLSAGLTALLLSGSVQAEDVFFEMTGKLSGEFRGYIDEGKFTGQDYQTSTSLSIEPELFWELNGGDDIVTFTPFYRIDQHDDERTHGDIRELSWIHVADDWELRTGLRSVFWGVTEFNHLVDVINQTDGIEDSDGEDKLGQPMINLSLVKDWGIVDLFVLPGFRERTFAGTDGRLRSGLVVDTDNARYESGDGDQHIDTAIRWSQSFDLFDVGLYWFNGTNRDPRFEVGMKNAMPVLIPVYEQMNQVGFDGQATIDSWLWKLELLWRDTSAEQYTALQAGVEYTFYGIAESTVDLGVLAEYGWDERGKNADANFQNDLFIGSRVTLNDEASTEFLAGVGYDVDYQSHSFFAEASSRFGDNWKVSLDARFFDAGDSQDPIVNIEQDDMVQLTADYYF